MSTFSWVQFIYRCFSNIILWKFSRNIIEICSYFHEKLYFFLRDCWSIYLLDLFIVAHLYVRFQSTTIFQDYLKQAVVKYTGSDRKIKWFIVSIFERWMFDIMRFYVWSLHSVATRERERQSFTNYLVLKECSWILDSELSIKISAERALRKYFDFRQVKKNLNIILLDWIGIVFRWKINY